MKTNWKRNIVLFLASQTISLFGSALVQYAIMWHITLKTQSGVMMTIYIICGFLPTFFLSPFAGVWADRYNRKTLIILSDSMIAVTTLIMALLFLAGFDAIWLLLVMSAIRALGSGVQTPAVGAFIPQLVPEDKLTKVNGINGSIQSTIMLVSPLASAALLTVTTLGKIFFIDVVTAAIAVSVLLIFLRVPAHAKALEKQNVSYFKDMRIGFDYIGKHDFLIRYFLYFAVLLFLVTPVAFLSPLQVTRSFGGDVWRLTAIEIAFSSGMIGGGILIAYWGGLQNRVRTIALAGMLMGVFTFALGVTPVFWIYLGFMAVSGVAMPFFNTPAMVMLQEKVEPDYLGRVFGVMGMISSSMMPLGMLVFGPLADTVKIEWLLIITGILIAVQSFFLLGNKVLIEAGKPMPKPSPGDTSQN